MDKNFLLEKSKSFCMLPWVHLHVTPTGAHAPCCIAESINHREESGQANNSTLMELVNSSKMKKLRRDMLDNIKNVECKRCHSHEEENMISMRVQSNIEYAQHFDNVIADTSQDGTMSTFHMRYFDFRFSNICNFKCRTCGPEYSSQWEQEYLKHNPEQSWDIPKFNKKNKIFLELLDQVDHLDAAYFAGGEPLITEEHYIMLEEMIKRKKTDIKLSYNTNLSNFKFKNKDIIDLWKRFKRIYIYASIDHYGERAEYIRHGTDWNLIEKNFLRIKPLSFINLQCNTVLSVYNLLTFDKFYEYLIERKLYTPNDNPFSIYPMSTPEYLSVHILPDEFKTQGLQALERLVKFMKAKNFREKHISQILSVMPWINAENYWDEGKHFFRSHTMRLDRIRKENFKIVFPELAELIDKGKKTHWLMQTNNF